jgi:alcohol dehydrogenase (cytochrome c)
MLSRSTLLAALLSAAVPAVGLAQTTDQLKGVGTTPGEILNYGMGYGLQRYSLLTEINRQNVKHLVPAWSYSMADNNGQQSQPMIRDGVMFITDHTKALLQNNCAVRLSG